MKSLSLHSEKMKRYKAESLPIFKDTDDVGVEEHEHKFDILTAPHFAQTI